MTCEPFGGTHLHHEPERSVEAHGAAAERQAWTTPRTWVANEILTATLLNTHLRDNLNALNASTNRTSLITTAGGPISTVSTAVMVGFGTAGATLTPSASGRFIAFATAQLWNDTPSTVTLVGTYMALRYGTGTAPSAGAAATGTSMGLQVSGINNANTQSVQFPGHIGAYAPGLTIGVQYWFDVVYGAIASGTAFLSNITLVAFEM